MTAAPPETSYRIVHEYAEGRASVKDFLNACRLYQGPAPHFLLSGFYDEDDDDDYDDPGYRHVFAECVDSVPEDDLVELLRAVATEWPQMYTLQTKFGESLLHHALQFSIYRDVQLLLAVPENARLQDGQQMTPLHAACTVSLYPVDTVVVHHLMDLDPDVLTFADSMNRMPLHYALRDDPMSSHVHKMIELRPDTVRHRDADGVHAGLRRVELLSDAGMLRGGRVAGELCDSTPRR